MQQRVVARPEVLRLVFGALIATASKRRLRRMRHELEARLETPGVIVLGETREELAQAIMLLAVAERVASIQRRLARR